MSKLLALCFPGSSGPQCIAAPGNIPTGGLYDTGHTIITNGITIFLVVGSIAAVLFLVYSGLQWVTSGGDKGKVQAARNRITYTIIGLVIMFISFFILTAISHIFGIDAAYR